MSVCFSRKYKNYDSTQEPLVIKRKQRTGDYTAFKLSVHAQASARLVCTFCPMRCAREIAWISCCGLKSEIGLSELTRKTDYEIWRLIPWSNKITVSAEVSVIPTPPARVLRM